MLKLPCLCQTFVFFWLKFAVSFVSAGPKKVIVGLKYWYQPMTYIKQLTMTYIKQIPGVSYRYIRNISNIGRIFCSISRIYYLKNLIRYIKNIRIT